MTRHDHHVPSRLQRMIAKERPRLRFTGLAGSLALLAALPLVGDPPDGGSIAVWLVSWIGAFPVPAALANVTATLYAFHGLRGAQLLDFAASTRRAYGYPGDRLVDEIAVEALAILIALALAVMLLADPAGRTHPPSVAIVIASIASAWAISVSAFAAAHLRLSAITSAIAFREPVSPLAFRDFAALSLRISMLRSPRVTLRTAYVRRIAAAQKVITLVLLAAPLALLTVSALPVAE